MFVNELTNAYPSAKVILTTRDPEKWINSIQKTVVPLVESPLWCVIGYFDPVRTGPLLRYVDLAWGGWCGMNFSRETLRRRFAEHNEHVRRVVPKENLLEFQVAQGWKLLCEFLQVEVPEGDFPHLNETADFEALQRSNQREGAIRAQKNVLKMVLPVVVTGIAIKMFYARR